MRAQQRPTRGSTTPDPTTGPGRARGHLKSPPRAGENQGKPAGGGPRAPSRGKKGGRGPGKSHLTLKTTRATKGKETRHVYRTRPPRGRETNSQGGRARQHHDEARPRARRGQQSLQTSIGNQSRRREGQSGRDTHS